MPAHYRRSATLAILAAAMFVASSLIAVAGEDREDTSEFDCCYKVVGVPDSDTLKIRAQPGWLDTELGRVPPNGTKIKRSICRGNWCMIQYNGTIGWVNQTYLAREASKK